MCFNIQLLPVGVNKVTERIGSRASEKKPAYTELDKEHTATCEIWMYGCVCVCVYVCVCVCVCICVCVCVCVYVCVYIYIYIYMFYTYNLAYCY